MLENKNPEMQAAENQATEPQAAEPQAAENQATELQAAESQTAEAQAAELQEPDAKQAKKQKKSKQAKTPKEPLSARIKALTGGKKFKIGTYTVGTTIIVLAILVVINMCVSALPLKWTSFDFTSNDLYSISDQTEQILESLDEPVKVYWIVQDGSEDDAVEKLLANYADLSKDFTYEKIDPVANPSFTSQYTTDSIYNNSLVVVNSDETKSRFVSYYDIYSYSYDDNYNEVVEYSGESALTSAVNYVTTDTQTKAYYLTGHGEDSIPTNLQSSMENDNLTTEELNLVSEEGVPDDCEALIIYSPARDISDDELTKIKDYMENGGNILLITDCDAEGLENVEELMDEYGIEPVDGMVVEDDSNYFMSNYPNYLLPSIGSHDITDPISEGNYYVLLPVAQGAELEEKDDVTTTALLSTTSEAYSKIDGIKATKAEKEDGDIEADDDGFALAVAAENSTNGSKLVWVGSSNIANSSVDEAVSGANTDMLLNSMGWMCEIEDSISIRAKTVDNEYLSLTAAQTNRWTVIMVILIPLAFVASGIYVWLRRRKVHA